MKPMQPMQPMAGMTPMQPMEPVRAWWPEELGQPASSGGQNDTRYAFFPDRHRLLVQSGGTLESYDSGDHRIVGVAQQQGAGQSLAFTSQHGTVRLDSLRRISSAGW